MNPKLKEFLQFIANLKPKLEQMGFVKTPSNVREAFANNQRRYMTDIDYTIYAFDDIIYNQDYPVCVRIYIPDITQSLEVGFFIHGGGHMCGNVAQYDGIARKIAKHTNRIIVSIDYRVSPESRYPTALIDCKKVIENIYQVLDRRNVNYTLGNLLLVGDSGGGALCASVVMDKEFVIKYNITHQILIYPSLDYTLSSPSLDKYATGYYLEKATIEWYFSHYCPQIEDKKSISPLYGDYYKEMPRTLVITAQYDPLVDEGREYCNNIQQQGIKTKYVEIPETIHAFLSLENLCEDACSMAYSEIKHFIKE